MPANNNHLQSLFHKYMNNNCTKEEWQELQQLVLEETNEPGLQQAFKAYWDQLNNTETNPAYWNEKFNQVLEEARALSVPVIPMKKKVKWTRWVAAACIILVTGYGLWVTVGHRSQDTGDKIQVAVHDVPAPSNTRAIITLANGQKVYIDSANNGTIAEENNVNVVKNNEGGIVYLSPAGGANSEQRTANSPISYNTLSNPRGSKVISLTLSDGTKVWLNSESSLKYPIAFNANTREVEITGEAYFEVRHNSKQPFKVHLPNGSVVEDIGTSFNVNAYTDEADIKTTLIEGSVRVSANSEQLTVNSLVLKPNQQAVFIPQTRVIRVQNNVDVESVMAWKNGKFQFDKTDIQTTMRQISRWYDVDIEYRDDVQGGFIGSIARKENVSQVLKMLELTGAVHFQIEGRKVIVMK